MWSRFSVRPPCYITRPLLLHGGVCWDVSSPPRAEGGRRGGQKHPPFVPSEPPSACRKFSNIWEETQRGCGGADVPADDAPAAAYRYLIKFSLAESLKVHLFKTRGGSLTLYPRCQSEHNHRCTEHVTFRFWSLNTNYIELQTNGELGYSRFHNNNVFILMFDMKISSREFWSEIKHVNVCRVSPERRRVVEVKPADRLTNVFTRRFSSGNKLLLSLKETGDQSAVKESYCF